MKQVVSERTRQSRLARFPPGAKMFHDLIWDLGICSIESIEPCNLFIVPELRDSSIYVLAFTANTINRSNIYSLNEYYLHWIKVI